jgi:glucose-1-phosphate cytidylyltransferase
MQAVILAGGLGTRFSEQTQYRPKPMIEIGGRPILWHIMKIYASHGVTEFIICCGYKGYLIKEYFSNYSLHQSDLEIDLASNKVTNLQDRSENWKITLVDTGESSMTGGRIARVAPYLSGETFCLTYGDGLSDTNITDTLKFHKQHGKNATLTAVYPPGRFGALRMTGDRVEMFEEKPKGDGAFVNGGFFVLNRSVLDLIEGDQTIFEQEPLTSLASAGELMAYKHEGFWQPMDTLRDQINLEDQWSLGRAPWKIW